MPSPNLNPETWTGLTQSQRAMVIKVFTTDEGCTARSNGQDTLTEAKSVVFTRCFSGSKK